MIRDPARDAGAQDAGERSARESDARDSGKLKWVSSAAGWFFILAALPISFRHPIAAGFFYVTGLTVLIGRSLLTVDMIKSVKLSAGGLAVELREAKEAVAVKVDQATEILAKVQQVEARLHAVVSEILRNEGGERQVGGLGGAASFSLFETIKDAEATDDRTLENVREVRRLLGLQLIFALIGESRTATGTGEVMAKLRSFNFELLSAGELRESARQDGVAVEAHTELINAYEGFLTGQAVPRQVLKTLYELRYRSTA